MNLQQERKPTFKQLIQSVARFYNIQIKNIIGTRREKNFVKARQIVAYLAREKLKKSFPNIAWALGGRDHTTAIYSYHKIKDKIERDEGFKKEVETILLENYIAQETETEFEKSKFIIKSPKDIPPQKLSPEHSIRQSDILKKYKEGQILEEIGKEYNLTRERIRQIVERGLTQSIKEIIREGIVIDLKEFLKEEKRKHLRAKIEKHGILKQESASSKQQKRWSRYYNRCRKCGTNIICHYSHGYCKRCYPKTEIFKELQESSHLRNIEKRKRYVKAYSYEYNKRPNIIEKRKKFWDLKYFGGNRERAIIRDKERCQSCGISRIENYKKYGRDFYVIHIKNSRDNKLENLLTLCKRCFCKKLRERRNKL